MKVYIKENSRIARLAAWKLGQPAIAITLGRTIHLYHTSKADFLRDQKWVCHELAHVGQYQRYGFIAFLLLYTWESLRQGYYNNKWEVEARAAEQDLSLLQNIDFR